MGHEGLGRARTTAQTLSPKLSRSRVDLRSHVKTSVFSVVLCIGLCIAVLAGWISSLQLFYRCLKSPHVFLRSYYSFRVLLATSQDPTASNRIRHVLKYKEAPKGKKRKAQSAKKTKNTESKQSRGKSSRQQAGSKTQEAKDKQQKSKAKEE